MRTMCCGPADFSTTYGTRDKLWRHGVFYHAKEVDMKMYARAAVTVIACALVALVILAVVVY